MNAAWPIFLGGIICFGVAILSRIWLPYADTGITDSAIYHLTATGAVIVSNGLAFGYFGQGFSKPNNRAQSETYGSLVTGVYLLIAAIITTASFIGTYFGLWYKLFWSLQVLQYVGLLFIWLTATKSVVAMAVEREGNARVISFRKQGALDNLMQVSMSLQNTELEVFKNLKRCINSLHDELKFFPNNADGIEAEQILSDVTRWAHHLRVINPKSIKEDHQQEKIDLLLIQGKDLQRRISQWKRV